MPFDENLAIRIRQLIRAEYSVTEKRMFGGLSFMVNGHMSCGVEGKDLVVRISSGDLEAALSLPHARPMDFTGRPIRGFVYVDPEGCTTDQKLNDWIQRGLDFVWRLPPKLPSSSSFVVREAASLYSGLCRFTGNSEATRFLNRFDLCFGIDWNHAEFDLTGHKYPQIAASTHGL